MQRVIDSPSLKKLSIPDRHPVGFTDGSAKLGFTSSPAKQRARLGSFPYNLLRSGKLSRFYELLTDFSFLEEKTCHSDFGIQALLSDFDLLSHIDAAQHPDRNPAKIRALRLIQRSLGLSADILAENPHQLATQLWGQLQGTEIPEIEHLLEQTKEHRQPWLRPITPSLIPLSGRLVSTWQRHSKAVTAIKICANDTQLISASQEQTVQTRDFKTGKLLSDILDSESSMDAIAFSSDGKWAVAGAGERLKIWNLEMGTYSHTPQKHSDVITAVAVTACGDLAISASRDNTLVVWDVPQQKMLQRLVGHLSIVTSVVFNENGQLAVSGSYDNRVLVWNLKSGIPLLELGGYRGGYREGHEGSVTAVAISRDNQRIVSGSSDNTLIIWDLAARQQIAHLEGHTDTINAVEITPDGTKIISASDDKTIRVWDFETGEELFCLKGHRAPVTTVAVTANSQHVMSGSSDSLLKLWDLSNENTQFPHYQKHQCSITSITVCAKGGYVVSSASEKNAQERDYQQRSEFGIDTAGDNPAVSKIAITPNGKQIVSTILKDSFKLWDLTTGQCFGTAPPPTMSKSHMMVLDLANQANFSVPHGSSHGTVAYLISPDEQHIISISTGNTFKVWRILDASHSTWGFSRNRVKLILQREFQLHFLAPISAMALTTDRTKVIIGLNTGIIIVWNWRTAKFLTMIGHHHVITSLIALPDGNRVVAASEDGALKLWNLNTGNVELILQSANDSGAVKALAVTQNGKRIISTSMDYTIKVWDINTAKPLLVLQGHRDAINAVSIMANDKCVVSISEDCTLRVWHLETGKEVAMLTGETPFRCCAVSPDSLTIIAGDEVGRVHFLKLEGAETL